MRSIVFIAFLVSVPGIAAAAPVGEQHRTITLPSAQARRIDHKPEMAVTVWYPAVVGTTEREKVIGPPDHPYFRVARMAEDATPKNGRHPVILLSHGFGGSAAIT
jgi:predicted dienelactone hydrolase